MDIKDFADKLGGEAYGASISAPGPGHSEDDRSLSVLFRPDGSFIVNSFVGQSFQLCRDYVREKIGGGDRQVDQSALKLHKKDKDTARLALRIWNSASDPIGTLAEKYLNSRSLILPGELRLNTLRFLWRCQFGTGATAAYHPALIAAFKSIKDGSIIAIHRIAITETGEKLERRALGPIAGAVIALDKVESDELYIGEGLETCLAARQLGMKPVWACGSAIGIGKFPIIPRINVLTILGEDCPASDAAILECGKRYRSAGKQVRALFPKCEGDFNDELVGQENARTL